ncbi:MAG: 3-oxoacyl-[acyl-carrier protein] reductase [Bryobacterales bacterium]|jgi:NAD(P)-dependent dehydrogenase (short-subunit alcohol dehydrogenase family)|nr:3-oxoacyl-[acyl-carrier protein] reductase [Bryobacterales bacterium]
MNLQGKICLVTGGVRGIGAATAMRLARAGADLALQSRDANSSAALELKAAIEALGRRCISIAADMAVPADATRTVQETLDGLGGIDVLVHNAGAAAPGAFLQVSEEVWYHAFNVHVHAAFHLCRAAVPHMTPKKEGAIVLMGSTAGHRGVLGAAAYSIVKGAIPQFTRVLARELADHNIRVNCVSPGVVRTRFQDMLTEAQVKNNLENRIPLHREGTSDEIAQVIEVLATNDFMTGSDVVVDGGLTMRMA